MRKDHKTPMAATKPGGKLADKNPSKQRTKNYTPAKTKQR